MNSFEHPIPRPARLGSRWLAIAVAAALPVCLQAQIATAPADQSERSLDEVVVEGELRLGALRQKMILLEDAFYSQYNELNENDLFDVSCEEGAATGTLLRRRFCRAGYESRAHETEGKSHHAALLHAIRKPGEQASAMEWVPPVPAGVAIARQRAEFRENMIAVTSEHPELLELLRQRAELAARYESLRDKSFGARARMEKSP